MEAEGQFLSQVEPHFPLPIETLEPVLARVLCDAAVGNLAQELFGENRISLASSAFGDCPRASENYLATAARRRESCLRHKEAILREAPPRAAHPMRVVAGFKNRPTVAKLRSTPAPLCMSTKKNGRERTELLRRRERKGSLRVRRRRISFPRRPYLHRQTSLARISPTCR